MIRGIYSAASGMMSMELMQDINANNMANINTPGYKNVSNNFQAFKSALLTAVSKQDNKDLGHIALGNQVLNTFVDFSQGDLSETGNPLDLGLQGDGFFAVKDTKTGETQYTRAGNFVRDGEGYLTTVDNKRVQGTSGDILVPGNAFKIEFRNKGEVFVNNQPVNTLKLVQFEHPEKLERLGNSVYRAETEQPQPADGTLIVEQGHLERSNANVISEMVNSITGFRTYEILQKSIQMQNETLGKSVNEVGKSS
jgi:flagellar basal-body rod protein FlgF